MNSPMQPEPVNDAEALRAFETALVREAQTLGLQLDAARVAKLVSHFELLRETNRQFNLTRITDPEPAAAKLYADSFAPLAWLRGSGIKPKSVVDVGSGAGFPAVPIAIAEPSLHVTAIDCTGKKVKFIASCARELAMANLHARQERAGEWRPAKRFDVILFKAVGPLARCLGFSQRLIASNGFVMVFKGRGLTRSELDEGQRVAEESGMQTWDVFDYDLTCGDETLEHSLVIYRRT